MYRLVTDRGNYKLSNNEYKIDATPKTQQKMYPNSSGYCHSMKKPTSMKFLVRTLAWSLTRQTLKKKLVTSEDWDNEDGVTISTCAVGPLLSMNDQCPQSQTLPTTQTIMFRSMKCGEGFIVEYSQKPSLFLVASQVLICARRIISSWGWCISKDLGRSSWTTCWSSPKKVCQMRSLGLSLSVLRSTKHSYFGGIGGSKKCDRTEGWTYPDKAAVPCWGLWFMKCPLSCPRFCACPMPETYHTGHLWIPLCPSESTHPQITFSEDFSEISEWLTLNSELTHPPHHRLQSPTQVLDLGHQLWSALSFSRKHLQRWLQFSELRALRATPPSLRATTSPNFQSWLPSVHVSLLLLGSGSII